MAYKAYPIFNMRQGKVTEVEPWLLPQDAFPELRNCFLSRGILQKRRGYISLGQMTSVDTSDNTASLEDLPVTGIFQHFDGPTPELLVANKERINRAIASPSVANAITVFADAGGGLVTVTAVGSNYTTGDIATQSETTNYNGTFAVIRIDSDNYNITATWVSDDATGLSSQERFEDLTRNKLKYIGSIGQNWAPSAADVVEGATSGATGIVEALITDSGSLANDDARGTIVFVNGGVTGDFVTGEELQESGTPANIAGESDGANSDEVFTGDSTNFIWSANWNNVTYITNNNDPIQKYDGTSLSQFTIDLDDDGTNNVNSCLLVFIVKERIVILSTQENGVDRLQRARWSTIKDPDDWPGDNFKDIPTQDVIVSGGFIEDDLYVWCEKSAWRFVYTGDPVTPFEWERISSEEGLAAQKSIVTHELKQYGIGPTRVQVSDGRSIVAADKKIQDFLLDWTLESLSYSAGILVDQERQIWFSYADADAEADADGNIYPNSALIFDHEDLSYSTYGLPVHSLGSGTLESDRTWETDLTWDEIDDPWNARTGQTGFPLTFMGGHNGFIYQLNTGGSDDGAAIEFSAKSGRWNPFVGDGREAALGWIDFLVTVDPDIAFTVEHFINNETAPIETNEIVCTSVKGSDDKAWHRAYVNAVGFTHSIKISNNAVGQRPEIHGIVPYFEPAGGSLG